MITCACLGISENKIVEAIDKGADTVLKVQEQTGVGMCCGLCILRLENIFSGSMTKHPAYQKICEALESKKNV